MKEKTIAIGQLIKIMRAKLNREAKGVYMEYNKDGRGLPPERDNQHLAQALRTILKIRDLVMNLAGKAFG